MLQQLIVLFFNFLANKNLFTWGTAYDGELGIENTKMTNLPMKVNLADHGQVKKVQCGPTYTALIDAEDYLVFFGKISPEKNQTNNSQMYPDCSFKNKNESNVSLTEDQSRVEFINMTTKLITLDSIKVQDFSCGVGLIALIDIKGDLFLYNEEENLYKVKLGHKTKSVKFKDKNFYVLTKNRKFLYEYTCKSFNTNKFCLKNYTENLFSINETFYDNIEMLELPYYTNLLFFSIETNTFINEKVNLLSLVKDGVGNSIVNESNFNSREGRSLLDKTRTEHSGSVYPPNRSAHKKQSSNTIQKVDSRDLSVNNQTRIGRISNLLGHIFDKKINEINSQLSILDINTTKSYIQNGKKKIVLERVKKGEKNIYNTNNANNESFNISDIKNMKVFSSPNSIKDSSYLNSELDPKEETDRPLKIEIGSETKINKVSIEESQEIDDSLADVNRKLTFCNKSPRSNLNQNTDMSPLRKDIFSLDLNKLDQFDEDINDLIISSEGHVRIKSVDSKTKKSINLSEISGVKENKENSILETSMSLFPQSHFEYRLKKKDLSPINKLNKTNNTNNTNKCNVSNGRAPMSQRDSFSNNLPQDANSQIEQETRPNNPQEILIQTETKYIERQANFNLICHFESINKNENLVTNTIDIYKSEEIFCKPKSNSFAKKNKTIKIIKEKVEDYNIPFTDVLNGLENKSLYKNDNLNSNSLLNRLMISSELSGEKIYNKKKLINSSQTCYFSPNSKRSARLIKDENLKDNNKIGNKPEELKDKSSLNGSSDDQKENFNSQSPDNVNNTDKSPQNNVSTINSSRLKIMKIEKYKSDSSPEKKENPSSTSNPTNPNNITNDIPKKLPLINNKVPPLKLDVSSINKIESEKEDKLLISQVQINDTSLKESTNSTIKIKEIKEISLSLPKLEKSTTYEKINENSINLSIKNIDKVKPVIILPKEEPKSQICISHQEAEIAIIQTEHNQFKRVKNWNDDKPILASEKLKKIVKEEFEVKLSNLNNTNTITKSPSEERQASIMQIKDEVTVTCNKNSTEKILSQLQEKIDRVLNKGLERRKSIEGSSVTPRENKKNEGVLAKDFKIVNSPKIEVKNEDQIKNESSKQNKSHKRNHSQGHIRQNSFTKNKICEIQPLKLFEISNNTDKTFQELTITSEDSSIKQNKIFSNKDVIKNSQENSDTTIVDNQSNKIDKDPRRKIKIKNLPNPNKILDKEDKQVITIKENIIKSSEKIENIEKNENTPESEKVKPINIQENQATPKVFKQAADCNLIEKSKISEKEKQNPDNNNNNNNNTLKPLDQVNTSNIIQFENEKKPIRNFKKLPIKTIKEKLKNDDSSNINNTEEDDEEQEFVYYYLTPVDNLTEIMEVDELNESEPNSFRKRENNDGKDNSPKFNQSLVAKVKSNKDRQKIIQLHKNSMINTENITNNIKNNSPTSNKIEINDNKIGTNITSIIKLDKNTCNNIAQDQDKLMDSLSLDYQEALKENEIMTPNFPDVREIIHNYPNNENSLLNNKDNLFTLPPQDYKTLVDKDEEILYNSQSLSSTPKNSFLNSPLNEFDEDLISQRIKDLGLDIIKESEEKEASTSKNVSSPQTPKLFLNDGMKITEFSPPSEMKENLNTDEKNCSIIIKDDFIPDDSNKISYRPKNIDFIKVQDTFEINLDDDAKRTTNENFILIEENHSNTHSNTPSQDHSLANLENETRMSILDLSKNSLGRFSYTSRENIFRQRQLNTTQSISNLKITNISRANKNNINFFNPSPKSLTKTNSSKEKVILKEIKESNAYKTINSPQSRKHIPKLNPLDSKQISSRSKQSQNSSINTEDEKGLNSSNFNTIQNVTNPNFVSKIIKGAKEANKLNSNKNSFPSKSTKKMSPNRNLKEKAKTSILSKIKKKENPIEINQKTEESLSTLTKAKFRNNKNSKAIKNLQPNKPFPTEIIPYREGSLTEEDDYLMSATDGNSLVREFSFKAKSPLNKSLNSITSFSPVKKVKKKNSTMTVNSNKLTMPKHNLRKHTFSCGKLEKITPQGKLQASTMRNFSLLPDYTKPYKNSTIKEESNDETLRKELLSSFESLKRAYKNYMNSNKNKRARDSLKSIIQHNLDLLESHSEYPAKLLVPDSIKKTYLPDLIDSSFSLEDFSLNEDSALQDKTFKKAIVKVENSDNEISRNNLTEDERRSNVIYLTSEDGNEDIKDAILIRNLEKFKLTKVKEKLAAYLSKLNEAGNISPHVTFCLSPVRFEEDEKGKTNEFEPLELDKSHITHISLNVSQRKSMTNLPSVSDDKLSGSYSSTKKDRNSDLNLNTISNFKIQPESTRSFNSRKDSTLNEILENTCEQINFKKFTEDDDNNGCHIDSLNSQGKQDESI